MSVDSGRRLAERLRSPAGSRRSHGAAAKIEAGTRRYGGEPIRLTVGEEELVLEAVDELAFEQESDFGLNSLRAALLTSTERIA